MRNFLSVVGLLAVALISVAAQAGQISFPATVATVHNYLPSGQATYSAIYKVNLPSYYDGNGINPEKVCTSTEVKLQEQGSGTTVQLDIPAMQLTCGQAPAHAAKLSGSLALMVHTGGTSQMIQTVYIKGNYKNKKEYSLYDMSDLLSLQFSATAATHSAQDYSEFVEVAFDSPKLGVAAARIGELTSPYLNSGKTHTWMHANTHSAKTFSLVAVPGDQGADPALSLTRHTQFTQSAERVQKLKLHKSQVRKQSTWNINL
jgi:hypothetical protein